MSGRDDLLDWARMKDRLTQERDEARREERVQSRSLDEAMQRLASEAETVCDLFGGDKSVDALRAALSVYLDALAARDAGLNR